MKIPAHGLILVAHYGSCHLSREPSPRGGLTEQALPDHEGPLVPLPLACHLGCWIPLMPSSARSRSATSRFRRSFAGPAPTLQEAARIRLERYAQRRPPCRITEATRGDRRHSQNMKAAGRECARSEWQSTKEESS